MTPRTLAIRAWRYWKRNGRYWTARKLLNALLARLALRLRLQYVPAMPVVAKIEATNACNGTCRLCPVARREPGRRAVAMMPWPLYVELIERLKDTLVVLDVTNWGESLLHPRILDMIRYAHRRRIYTYLSTNLHTVRQGHVEGLMTCGLDELTLSLHGLSETSYQAYQPGFTFARASRTIEQLVDARRRLGSATRPKIRLNFVVTRHNRHEADRLPALAADLGVEGMLSEPSLNVRFLLPPELVRDEPERARTLLRQQMDDWLSDDRAYERPMYRRVLEEPQRLYDGRKVVPCDWPWTKIVFNCDAAVSVCCGSYSAADDLATYAHQPLRQLWNSVPYRRARASFTPGAAGPHGPRVLCERCPGVLL